MIQVSWLLGHRSRSLQLNTSGNEKYKPQIVSKIRRTLKISLDSSAGRQNIVPLERTKPKDMLLISNKQKPVIRQEMKDNAIWGLIFRLKVNANIETISQLLTDAGKTTRTLKSVALSSDHET